MSRSALRRLSLGSSLVLVLALAVTSAQAGLQTTSSLAQEQEQQQELARIGAGSRRARKRGLTRHRGRPGPRYLGGTPRIRSPRRVYRSVPSTGYLGYGGYSAAPMTTPVYRSPTVYRVRSGGLGVNTAPVRSRNVGPRNNAEVSAFLLQQRR